MPLSSVREKGRMKWERSPDNLDSAVRFFAAREGIREQLFNELNMEPTRSEIYHTAARRLLGNELLALTRSGGNEGDLLGTLGTLRRICESSGKVSPEQIVAYIGSKRLAKPEKIVALFRKHGLLQAKVPCESVFVKEADLVQVPKKKMIDVIIASVKRSLQAAYSLIFDARSPAPEIA